MGLERAESSTEWVPPPEFDGFQIDRPLGRGGMGFVYLGRDLALDPTVALKFIAAANLAPDARERFLTEAHANFVGIYRVGDVEGRPYIAYEFIGGVSLDKLVRPIPWARALDIGIGIARGLNAAHRRNVMHPDIKPANVMLADDGEVKLLDFGLAKLMDTDVEARSRRAVVPARGAAAQPASLPPRVLEPGESRATTELRDVEARPPRGADGPLSPLALTITGQLLGTPLYMAPERWLGGAAHAVSDIYALGLVLYELLVGQLPFARLHYEALGAAVIGQDLPSLADPAPDVPRAFSDVVARCVRRTRDDRYQSAEQILAALEAVRTAYTPFASHPSGRPNDVADDAVRVSASFSRIVPRAEAFASQLYARAFERHPEVRRLFPTDLAQQRKKLMGALQLVVENLKQPDVLTTLLEDLGRRHARYGVKTEHFDAIGEALLATIGDFDRAHYSVATEQAWARAYARITEAMQRGLVDERPTPPPTAFDRVAYQRRLALDPPRTRYTDGGDVDLAYQVFGAGPPDLVLLLGWVTHLEIGWQSPELAQFLRRLASFSRVIVFDKRGTGLSDRHVAGVGSDERIADVLAVMRAAECERAVIFGISEAASLAALFAQRHPERTSALIAYAGSPCMTARADYPDGFPLDAIEAAMGEVAARWGEPLFLDQEAPSVAHDERFQRWWATYLRSGASPSGAAALFRVSAQLDVRRSLGAMREPTLVLHRSGDALMPIAGGRALAAAIPDARLVELAGGDHLPFTGDVNALLDEVQRFVVATTPPGRGA